MDPTAERSGGDPEALRGDVGVWAAGSRLRGSAAEPRSSEDQVMHHETPPELPEGWVRHPKGGGVIVHNLVCPAQGPRGERKRALWLLLPAALLELEGRWGAVLRRGIGGAAPVLRGRGGGWALGAAGGRAR